MFEITIQLCGGIGLFLLGMTLMTDSLKALAGEKLRLWLSKFTGSPIKGMFSGIGFTLAVQSSTATTLATIGFVSAGVLTFSQAMGVIVGANIGTTSTGWMVALLGVKFSITSFALPFIALGAILKLLTHGKFALLGLCLAGFGLIFFGIDQLQIAMASVAHHVDLSVFTTTSFLSKLLLVFIGLVMTILLQSSSAAITTTLAALAGQAIQLEQALMLVIGQNIGTVATAILAVIGSTANAKRTAAVHVLFNVMSAIIAFFILLPLFVWLYDYIPIIHFLDHVIIVAAFHTAFSVVGALFFMPFLTKFGRLIIYFIPDNQKERTEYLDQASLSVPALAISTAERVLFLNLYDQLCIFRNALTDGTLVTENKLRDFDNLISDLDLYLEKIALPELIEDREKLIFLLRLAVYIRVLRSDLDDLNYALSIRAQPKIFQVALDYVNILDHSLNELFVQRNQLKVENFHEELLSLKQWADEHRKETREKIIEYVQLNKLSAARNLDLLAAQRWLDRLIAHTQRLANVMSEKSTVLSSTVGVSAYEHEHLSSQFTD
ncbi:Na/Pi cotransporter family protein [Acinetobacter equi]|uniref:Na/Pi cotransporter n=1 Tax=Acinetobacter equi TaxID=1324350 RepID=A0A0N7GXI2_9GAMM|nr:Na/Pi symporter [Acinetobacter equi]ALH94787.1 Na/Pi cotransporter [Acinetobacter equi]